MACTELAECGCGTWIRTKINGAKTRCPTIRRSRNASTKLVEVYFTAISANKAIPVVKFGHVPVAQWIQLSFGPRAT